MSFKVTTGRLAQSLRAAVRASCVPCILPAAPPAPLGCPTATTLPSWAWCFLPGTAAGRCSSYMTTVCLCSYHLVWQSLLSPPVPAVPMAFGPSRPPDRRSSPASSLRWPGPPARSKAPASFHFGFSKIYRSPAFHGELQAADLVDTFPQPSALPLMPCALQMVSFPPALPILPSSKETQCPQGPQLRSCAGPAPLSARAARKGTSCCTRGCSPGLHPHLPAASPGARSPPWLGSLTVQR